MADASQLAAFSGVPDYLIQQPGPFRVRVGVEAGAIKILNRMHYTSLIHQVTQMSEKLQGRKP